MTYPILSISIIILVCLIDAILRTLVIKDRTTWYVLAIMIVLTLIFDKILVMLPIVTYNEATLSGIMIAGIPIEDFSYTIAIVIITLSIKKYYERNI